MHDLHVNFVISAALTDELLTEKLILFFLHALKKWLELAGDDVLSELSLFYATLLKSVYTLLLINWTMETNNVFLVIELAYKKNNIQCSCREMQ